MITARRRRQQRGSALLIVLVFAAMAAIMLYREMPVVAFEAERQKEQLLIDRGSEYKRAVQLYVRKFQTFPPSIDALENTNRMRFLRNRYVDPYSGKEDWRFLHAGPGGVITDSKIKQNSTGTNGSGTTSGSNSSSSSPLGAPSSVTNPFSNSFDGSNPFPAAPSTPPGAGLAQRPPAVAAGSSVGSANLDPNIAAAIGTDPSIQNPSIPYPGYPGPQTGSGDPSQASSSGAVPGMPGRFRGMNPIGSSYPPGQISSDGSQPTPGPTDQQNLMQSMLGNSNPQPAVQNTNATAGSSGSSNGTGGTGSMNGSGTSTMGAMSSTGAGGIAGVASKSPGKTIKSVNDQTDRSLWEFVYDMQKEAQANAPSLGTNGNANSSNNNNIGSGSQQSSGSGTNGTGGDSSNTNSNNTLTLLPPPGQTAPSSNQ